MKDNPFDPRQRQRRFGDPDLTRRILERTSGAACARAETLLAERWDAAPAAVDAGLLDAHLARCPACRELAAVLARLQATLPRLAEREPGPAFTAAVLAATSARRPTGAAVSRARGPLAVLEEWSRRLQAGARRAWERPRFALEAAWTTAALLSLMIWSPLLPDETPVRFGRAVQAGAGAVPQAVEHVERLGGATLSAGRERLAPALAWARTGAADVRRFVAALIDRADDREDDRTDDREPERP